jgi:hypothetical protein
LLDGKKVDTDFVLPEPGNHVITCVLLKDGEEVRESQNSFELLSKEN